MNVKTLILFCLVCLCPFYSLLAQDNSPTPFNQSDIAVWYKITNQEAEQIFKGKQLLTDTALLHSWVTTFPCKEYSPKNIELKGYYLKVSANGENLNIELKDYNSISAQILRFQQGFALRVVDSMGVLIPNASVFYNDKIIPFDTETQTYRCHKCKQRGLLVLKALDEAVFYEVKELYSYRYSRKKPFFQTKVGKVIKYPYFLQGELGEESRPLLSSRENTEAESIKAISSATSPNTILRKSSRCIFPFFMGGMN